MIENMPYTIEKEQEDFELKNAEEKERILGRSCCCVFLTVCYSLTGFNIVICIRYMYGQWLFLNLL